MNYFDILQEWLIMHVQKSFSRPYPKHIDPPLTLVALNRLVGSQACSDLCHLCYLPEKQFLFQQRSGHTFHFVSSCIASVGVSPAV